jgi:hypothetical protein
MQPSRRPSTTPDDAAFRDAFREIAARSGRSLRGLSVAMGRDAGYVAALLDPTRPSRARPTPQDLLSLSEATGIPFVELLERLWGIPMSRLADELAASGGARPGAANELSRTDQELLAEFGEFLASRRQAHRDARVRSGA